MSLVRHLFKKCGKNVTIENNIYFGTGENVEIDDYSGIGSNCEFYDRVKMGKYIMMGSDVKIIAFNHEYSNLEKPMCLQGFYQEIN